MYKKNIKYRIQIQSFVNILILNWADFLLMNDNTIKRGTWESFEERNDREILRSHQFISANKESDYNYCLNDSYPSTNDPCSNSPQNFQN